MDIVFGPHKGTDGFMVTHHLFLCFLQRLAAFISMTLSFMRTITILVPFRKIPSKKVYTLCLAYGMIIAITTAFGVSMDSDSRTYLATNVFIFGPTNRNFIYIFYIAPFVIADLVTMASIIIATWKLNIKKRKYNYQGQERENRVRREMTATIRLVGLIFAVCNTGYPVYIIYLTRTIGPVNLSDELSSRITYPWIAYILGCVLSYVEAALTPIVLTARGSQLQKAHQQNLQRAITRLSSKSRVLNREGMDRMTLQFLAASSMQLSSLGQDIIQTNASQAIQRNSHKKFNRNSSKESRLASSSAKLPAVSEELETTCFHSIVQIDVLACTEL